MTRIALQSDLLSDSYERIIGDLRRQLGLAVKLLAAERQQHNRLSARFRILFGCELNDESLRAVSDELEAAVFVTDHWTGQTELFAHKKPTEKGRQALDELVFARDAVSELSKRQVTFLPTVDPGDAVAAAIKERP